MNLYLQIIGSQTRPMWQSRFAGPLWFLSIVLCALSPNSDRACFAEIGQLNELKVNSSTLSSENWLRYTDSPVFTIDSLDIPSKQTGILENLVVEVNQKVLANQKIGNLDRTAAKLEESVAMIQSQFAATIANDESDIEFAKMIVEETRIALDSYEQISARGSATDSEMRSKKLAVAQSELKVHNAIQSREQAKLKSRLAQVAVLTARQNLDGLDFVSPFEGVVTTVFRQKGEWVQTGQPVVRVVRMNELRVDCFVARSLVDVASLVGQPVLVVVESPNERTDTVAGKVTRFEPEVTATGEIRLSAIVQNQLQNGQWILLPGMVVELRIQAPNNHLSANWRRSPDLTPNADARNASLKIQPASKR